MATFTTDFPTTAAPRTRADRFADGVIAGYIKTLAAESTQPAGAQVTNSSALAGAALVAVPEQTGVDAADAPIHIYASRGRSEAGSRKRSGSWNRVRLNGTAFFQVPCLCQPC